MKNKNRFFILGGFLLLCLTLSGFSCQLPFSKKTATNPTPSTSGTQGSEELTIATPASFKEALDKYLATAKARAKEWENNAVLVEVSVKLPSDLSSSKANQTYVFGSTKEPLNWWTISISEKTGKYIRATIPKEDYLGNTLQPINQTYWKINYLEAFQLAEKYGGKDFRAKNQVTEITLTLAQGEPRGWLWWVAEYQSASGETTKIRINSNDKSVVDEQGNIISK